MSRGRWIRNLAAAFCVLAFPSGASLASAEVTAPQAGAWKGMTKQGYAVSFQVGSDRTVSNFRFTYREPICGVQSPHITDVSLGIDEAGHFGGTIQTYYLEFEGTFTAPDQVQGKLISLEHTGVPGCLRTVVAFTASPSSGTDAEPETRKCKAVEFGQPPDGGAYEIRATGAGCEVARKVARTTKARRLGSEVVKKERSFNSHGFHCVGIEPFVVYGSPPIRYTCTQGDAEITFKRKVL